MDRFDEGQLSRESWKTNRGKNYIEKTKNRLPKPILINLVKEIEPGKAVELGIGAGNDTLFLLQNGWNVEAIDINEEGQNRVKTLLDDTQKEKFIFKNQKFEDLNLEKNSYDLVVGFDSLHFCEKKFFTKFFNNIIESLKPNGYFIGSLLGNKDSWKSEKDNIMMFFSNEEIKKLFKEFEILILKENERDGQTISGKPKHWHSFLIKARKKSR